MDQALNTSTSSKNNRSHQSSASRGGDRYNHYRRDAPTRVKPWMRDKGANSGSSGNANASAGISSRVSRFRGSRSNSNHSTNNNSFGAAGTLSEPNSCANSVCSTSSFSDTAAAATLPTHQRLPSFPQEVHQVQVLSGNQSLLLDESSVTGGIQYTPEEAASQSSRSGATDQAVRSKMQEDMIEKEGSSSVRSDQNTENTEGESTDESPAVVEEDLKSTPQQLATENDRAPEENSTQPHPNSNEAASANYLDEKKSDVDEDIDDTEEEEAPKEEFYDVLASVQPSSYNPMAATPSKKQQPQPVSVAAYATLNKPTPLATEQAALLNDAIVEEEEASEEEEEEPSLVEDDDDNDDDEHDNEIDEEPTALDQQEIDPVTSQDENFIGSIVDSSVGYTETSVRSVTPVNALQSRQVEVTPEAYV